MPQTGAQQLGIRLSSFCSRLYHTHSAQKLEKGSWQCTLPISPQSPKRCPWHSTSDGPVEHRVFQILGWGTGALATSFLHTSFLQAFNTEMLRSVHGQKLPQASAYLCLAKLLLCLPCLPVCLCIHSHWLHHSQGRTSTTVFSTNLRLLFFAAVLLSLWKWWHKRSVYHSGRLAVVLCVWLPLSPRSNWCLWLLSEGWLYQHRQALATLLSALWACCELAVGGLWAVSGYTKSDNSW